MADWVKEHIIASAPRARKLATGALLATALLTAVAAADDSAKLQRQRKQLSRVRAQIEAVTKDIANDRIERDSRIRALRRAEQALAVARTKLRHLDVQLQDADRQLQQAQAQHDKAQARLASQRHALAAQTRAAYEIGTPSPLALLLGGGDTARNARLRADYDALARARAAAIAAVRKQVQRVQALQQQVQARRDRAADAKQQQQAALQDLQRRQHDRAAAVAQLRSKIKGEKRNLAHLRASEREVEKLLDELSRRLGKQPYTLGQELPFAKLRGRLPWPLRGSVLARFGAPKADGRLHWKGLWIAAPQGTPVRACARGRVAYVGWLSRYGLIVVLQHDHDYFTLYGHAASVSAQAGEVVDAGQVIATAGETGGYEHSGLYLEIRRGTKALNPSHWLHR